MCVGLFFFWGGVSFCLRYYSTIILHVEWLNESLRDFAKLDMMVNFGNGMFLLPWQLRSENPTCNEFTFAA